MEGSKAVQIRKKLPDRSYTGRFINFIKGKLIKGEGESEAVFKDFLYVDNYL